MKREGNLYKKLLNRDLIGAVIDLASEGKRKRPSVRRVLEHRAEYVEKIYTMLETGTYKPSKYHVFTRYDHHAKKTRTIRRPEFFPDQIIHWLTVIVCQPVFMRGMDYWNCGSIPGRGIHHGYKAVKRWLQRDAKNTKYCLKMDIKKFYDSIPHDKLMDAMRRKIKDERMLSLIQQVVDTTETGIPIGNYTSQWFANFYLERLDHYIRETLKIKYYARYIDDTVLFWRNKKELHKARAKISVFLRDILGLQLKANWQVFPVSARGVDFLGYIFRRGYIKLRAVNFLSMVRQARVIKRLIVAKMAIPYKIAAGFISRVGQLKYFDSFLMWTKYLKQIKLNILRKVVSYENKKHSQAAVV